MNINFEVVKAQFFDSKVTDGLSKKAKAVLSRFGSYVRRSARSSIQPARTKAPAEMTNREAELFERRQRRWAKGKIDRQPTRPERVSKPGDPPFAHGRQSPIRMIYFIYDPKEQSVIVGPIAFGQRPGVATEALEEGGASIDDDGDRIRIRARPFMRPAFARHLDELKSWKNAL